MKSHNVSDDILILFITLLVVLILVIVVNVYMNRGPSPHTIRGVRDIPTPPLTPFPGDVEVR